MYHNFTNLFSKLSESPFYKEYVSFSKTYRLKSVRLAVLQGIPQLCCPHQLVLILFTNQKLTMQLSSCSIVFWDIMFKYLPCLDLQESSSLEKN